MFAKVLTQTLRPWEGPVACLFKRRDRVSAGGLACLWAVATTTMLVIEADKLTVVVQIGMADIDSSV